MNSYEVVSIISGLVLPSVQQLQQRDATVDGYTIISWDLSTKFHAAGRTCPMEKSKLAETEKGEKGEQQSQEHPSNFL
jgi:hypothetical protein